MTFDRFPGVAPLLASLGAALALQTAACTPELQLADEPDAGREPPAEADAGIADAAAADMDAAIPVVLATALASPRGLIFDDNAAYVMARPEGLSPGGGILRIDRDSSAVSVLVSATEPSHLTADEAHLYWSDSADGWIRRVDKLGQGSTKLGHAGAEVTHLAVNADGVVLWATSAVEVFRSDATLENGAMLHRFDHPVTGLVAHNADVLVSLTSGEMWRLPLAGGDPQLLFAHESFDHGFVSDGQQLFWIDTTASSIRAGNIAGHESHQIVAALPDAITSLAVSYRYVLWTDPAAGAIRRAFKSGTGPVETLATHLSDPADIAALDFWAAWVNRTDGTVMALSL